jgi:hypothetical protein
MSDEQIERMVTDKMREQWSTMKKAFSELSKERLGAPFSQLNKVEADKHSRLSRIIKQ